MMQTMNAAIAEPTCGIRSNRPTMSASTIGNGAPTITAAMPTTVPAMTEMTTLPSSANEIVRLTASMVRSTRAAVPGGHERQRRRAGARAC